MTNDSSKRILVADDDPEIRRLLGSVLRSRGLAVDLVANGKEALENLREHRYAVIILDLMMPVVDGFAVLDALGTEQVVPAPIVLVVTGAERPAIESLDARVIHGIIRKPFDPLEIASIVQACTEIRDRGAFEAMAIAAVLAGTPLMAFLTRLS